MTCLEVRERLTEHSLGLLTKVDASEVERHLEWCAGCRKEAGELEEGAASMALAMPVEDPRPSLEARVVDRLQGAAGRVMPGRRSRTSGRLVAVTLAAALVAVGAMGWAIAERQHALSLAATVSAKEAQVARLAQLLEGFRGRGDTFTASLAPAPGSQGRGGGSAVISSASNLNDFIFVDVLLPGSPRGPFTVQLVDNKSALKMGQLVRMREGDWVLYKQTKRDLSRLVSVTILDGTSRTVLTGVVQPYSK